MYVSSVALIGQQASQTKGYFLWWLAMIVPSLPEISYSMCGARSFVYISSFSNWHFHFLCFFRALLEQVYVCSTLGGTESSKNTMNCLVQLKLNYLLLSRLASQLPIYDHDCANNMEKFCCIVYNVALGPCWEVRKEKSLVCYLAGPTASGSTASAWSRTLSICLTTTEHTLVICSFQLVSLWISIIVFSENICIGFPFLMKRLFVCMPFMDSKKRCLNNVLNINVQDFCGSMTVGFFCSLSLMLKRGGGN